MRHFVPSLLGVASLGFFLASGCGSTTPRVDALVAEHGSPEAAVEVLLAEVDLHPADVALRRQLGLACIRSGDLFCATSQLEWVVERDPSDADAHCLLGTVYEETDRYDDAMRSYSHYIRADRHLRKRIEKRVRALQRRSINAWAADRFDFESTLRDGDEQTLAVLPFDDAHCPSLAGVGSALGVQMATDLGRVRDLDLVERLRLDAVLRELDLARGRVVDISTAPRLGRLLGAGRLITGSVVALANQELQIEMAVLDPSASTQVATFTKRMSVDGFFRAQKEIVFEVLSRLGYEPSPLERREIEAQPLHSLDAFVALGRGFEADRESRYADAREAYRDALEADDEATIILAAMESLDIDETSVQDVRDELEDAGPDGNDVLEDEPLVDATGESFEIPQILDHVFVLVGGDAWEELPQNEEPQPHVTLPPPSSDPSIPSPPDVPDPPAGRVSGSAGGGVR